MLFTILVICVCGIYLADGESCATPTGVKGTCKSLNECDILAKIVTKTNRTPQDEHFLRQSKCGYDEALPKVCCPDSEKLPCSTPEGNAGVCVSVQSCPHLLAMLKDPKKSEYVKNSACASPEDQSVCCGPPPGLEDEPVYKNQCANTVSAFPPDPDGGCCGVESSLGTKILNGIITTIDRFPWLVVIEYVKPGAKTKLLCGGSLISGKYVLTAAHCVTGTILRKGTPKNVRLGEHNLTNVGPDCESWADLVDCTDGMILAPIEKTTPHPEYDAFSTNKEHDIALIRLKIYAPYTEFIRPICLPKIDYVQSLPTDFLLYVAGWGRYIQNITATANIFQSSDVKRHVDLPYVQRDICQTAIRTLKGAQAVVFGDGQICAGGDKGKGTCKGDSGGPLMFETAKRQYEAVGLLSIGAVICGLEGIPSVFTHVYKYLPWINANIKP